MDLLCVDGAIDGNGFWVLVLVVEEGHGESEDSGGIEDWHDEFELETFRGLLDSSSVNLRE